MNTHFYNPVQILNNGKSVALIGDKLVLRTGGLSYRVGRDWSVPAQIKWYRDGEAIPESNTSTYQVTEADLDKKITVSFTFQEIDGTKATVFNREPMIGTDARRETLACLYSYLLKRDPDRAGLIFWADYLAQLEEAEDPMALTKVIEAYQSSDDYKAEMRKLR